MADVKAFLLAGLTDLRVMAEDFVESSLKLLKALGPWAVPFVASYLVLGVIPFVFAMNIGNLTDAIIGARGIGTMTIDVSGALRTFVIVAVLGFASYTFLSRFEGKAAELGQTFAELVAVFLLAGFLIDLGWWGVALFTLVLLPVRVIFDKIPFLRYALIIPAVLLFTACASNVTEYAVIRAVTVGDAMTTVAASGCLTIIVCILLLRHRKEVENSHPSLKLRVVPRSSEGAKGEG